MLRLISRLLKQQDNDERWHLLDNALSEAFKRVRNDTKNLFSWIRYVNERADRSDERHEKAERQLAEQKAAVNALQAELVRINENLETMQKNIQKGHENSPFPDLVRTKSGPKSEPAFRTRFDNKVVAISRPIKKDYIMQQILNMAEKGQYTTKQIETIIVREKMLCGRTAFYDYLKELRLRNSIEEGPRSTIISKNN
ncbi:hypothetical protein HY640_00885 [Candidatus Woesearchaeota archaeon]|nr:hypothetical protein [Candidatus Woesearchaeota archaeon]